MVWCIVSMEPAWVVDRPSTSTSFDEKYLNTTGDGIVSSSAQVTDGSGIISGSTHLLDFVTSSGDISGSGTGSFGILSVGGGIFTSFPVVVEYPLIRI